MSWADVTGTLVDSLAGEKRRYVIRGAVGGYGGFCIGAALVVVDPEGDLRNGRGDRSHRRGKGEKGGGEGSGELHFDRFVDGLMILQCLVEERWCL